MQGRGRAEATGSGRGWKPLARRGAAVLAALATTAAWSATGIAGASGGPLASVARAWPAVRAAQVRPAVIADDGLERLRTEVTVSVDGATRVARFEVQEEFRNLAGRVLEADYLYPIPRGAVFTDLSLFLGETELRGEVLDAARARAVYEEIMRTRKDPALVELVGSGLVRTRVFPIEPGQTRKIILRYAQVLPRDVDVVHLRYPRVTSVMVPRADDRILPPEPQGFAPPRRPGADVGFALNVRITGAERFGAPFSPTHTIDVRRAGSELHVAARADARAARSDFDLLLPLAGSEIGASLLVHSPDPGREEGYFLLLVSPPAGAPEARIARDLTLVLDVSGSMSGHKIVQARSALRQLLQGLDAGDRFRLITFSNVVREHHPEPLAATRENVRAAIEDLEGMPASGGTNIHEALQRALAPASGAGRLSIVVFLTDGMPTVGETSPERIAAAAEALRDAERVFAFGVGEDVNTYVLDRLVEGGRGSVRYVRPDEDVEAAVSALARRIGAPVLTDLRLVEAPVELEEPYPSPLPDLFHGDELVLLGRYRGEGAGALVLEGRRQGGVERFSFPVRFPAREAGSDFVARLWAARKAGALGARIRLHGADAETVQVLRDLGTRYGILTEYTSYLVLEPGASVPGQARLEDTVLMSPPAEAQTGAKAFRRARESAALSAAPSIAAADDALMAAPSWSAAGAPHEGSWRRAGRRVFRLRDGVWEDVRLKEAEEDAPVVRVAPWSAAWLDLLERLPGLRSAAALGERVKIAGAGLVLEIGPGGEKRLEARALERLARAFAADR